MVMTSTIGRMPAMRSADAGAREAQFRERRIANAFRSEFLEKALAHRIVSAIAADVLAHQEDAFVSLSERHGSLRERLRDRWSLFFAAARLGLRHDGDHPSVTPAFGHR